MHICALQMFLILDFLCFFNFQIDKDYIISLILNMIVQYGEFINYYLYLLCVSFHVSTAFNDCAQWSDVDNQKIDFSIISMGAMSHTI